jgi:hypothetical protein
VQLKSFSRSPYALWLGLGLVFALTGFGFDSPDEHFPTLEIAGRFLFGHYVGVWEWDAGLRSWLQPLFLTAVLKPWVLLGVQNRLWLDSIARVFNVLWFLPAIWAVGKLSGKQSQWWLAACWPLLVWGTRHGSDTFCIPPMLAGLALFLTSTRPLLAGALLGAAFELRFTTGLFSVLAVGVATFVTRQTRLRSALTAGAGFVAAAAVLGLFDWLGYWYFNGAGKLPAWKFFQFNILLGSGSYNPSPWYELLFYGLLIWVPPFAWLKVPAVLRDRSGEKTPRWALLTWIACSFVLACVKHKELRFDLPLVPFALMATVPYLSGRMFKLSAGLNVLMLLTALVLYRDPHGAFVRAIDAASQDREVDLWITVYTANFPEFYLRQNMRTHVISLEEGNQVCAEQRPGTLVTTESCSSCTLLREIDPGLGYRLRQLISITPAPKYVYRCGL